MNFTESFITAGQFTINIEQINYVEVSEEFATVIHFCGGRNLQLGDSVALQFWVEWKDRLEKFELSAA